MGLFDTLVFDCPSCGKKSSAQIKFMPEPYLDTYQAGDKIDINGRVTGLRSPPRAGWR